MTHAPLNFRPPAPARLSCGGRAFTLIELMVSIAIVVLLILGVNQIFSITTQTIGAGQQLATAVRENRTTQSVIYDDLKHAVTGDGAPFFIIRNQRVPAFLDAADELSDRDYAKFSTTGTPDDIDDAILSDDSVNQNNKEGDVPGEQPPRTQLNSRNHRIDMLSFFARGLYRRQTGDNGSYAASMSCGEAWVNYGHLLRADNGVAPYWHAPGGANLPQTGASSLPPGPQDWQESRGSNPNNFYARQWIVGCSRILLKEPVKQADNTYRIDDTAGNHQTFFGRPATAIPQPPLSPLCLGTKSTKDTNDPLAFADPPQIQSNRFDLAGTSIDGFRKILGGYTAPNPPTADPYNAGDWVNNLNSGPPANGLLYRFYGNPQPARPITSAGMASTVPCLLPSCTQFVVEYAGDFVAQDANGDVTGVAAYSSTPANHQTVVTQVNPGGTDGQIDFVVDATGAKRIRWYGFPRDVTGALTPGKPDGAIHGYGGAASDTASSMPDVVPLRDVTEAYIVANNLLPAGNFYLGAPFERNTDTEIPERASYVDPANKIATDAKYTCAWGPDTVGVPYPKMIRITLTLDDPRGKLREGQTYEYIIQLP